MSTIGDILSGEAQVLLCVVPFLYPIQVEELRQLCRDSQEVLQDIPCQVNWNRRLTTAEWMVEDWENIKSLLRSNEALQLEFEFETNIREEDTDTNVINVLACFESALHRFQDIDCYPNWRLKCRFSTRIKIVMERYQDVTGRGRRILEERLRADRHVWSNVPDEWVDQAWLVQATIAEVMSPTFYFPRLETLYLACIPPAETSERLNWLGWLHAPKLKELLLANDIFEDNECVMTIQREDPRFPNLSVSFDLTRQEEVTALISLGSVSGEILDLHMCKDQHESGIVLPPFLQIPGLEELIDWVDLKQYMEMYKNKQFQQGYHVHTSAAMIFSREGDVLVLRSLCIRGGDGEKLSFEMGEEIRDAMRGVMDIELNDLSIEEEKSVLILLRGAPLDRLSLIHGSLLAESNEVEIEGDQQAEAGLPIFDCSSLTNLAFSCDDPKDMLRIAKKLHAPRLLWMSVEFFASLPVAEMVAWLDLHDEIKALFPVAKSIDAYF